MLVVPVVSVVGSVVGSVVSPIVVFSVKLLDALWPSIEMYIVMSSVLLVDI